MPAHVVASLRTQKPLLLRVTSWSWKITEPSLETDRSHIRIAVDAMGGDFAPHNVLAGALAALRATNNRFEILFVGKEDVLKQNLSTMKSDGLSYRLVDAREVIDMNDGATAAIKQKKNSSISVGLTMQREGRADAFVSAGHTGAVLSASTLILGRIEGVSRPTIGTFLPTERGVCLLVDAGANIDCKPQHLYEFAVMGSIYSEKTLDIRNPSVGMLSIGEEDTKGNEITLEAHRLLSRSKLNFIGNVEGRDILKGKANVVVCDGFVGNIVLKFAESVLDFLKGRIRRYADRSFGRKVWAGMMAGTLRGILKDFDYQEQGGVPLLGVNGVSIIGHGKSTPKAITNMILRAEEIVKKDINRTIQETLLKT